MENTFYEIKHPSYLISNLPNTVQNLKINLEEYSQIDNLPSTITHLILGKYFNQPIDNLPTSIVSLEFDNTFHKYDTYCYFDKSLENLPSSIEHLILPDSYNIELNGLPNSLINLVIGGHYSKSINNLPNSIKELTFEHIILRDYNGKLSDYQYPNIRNVPIDKLPTNLEKILIVNIYSGTIELGKNSKYSLLEMFNKLNEISYLIDRLKKIQFMKVLPQFYRAELGQANLEELEKERFELKDKILFNQDKYNFNLEPFELEYFLNDKNYYNI